MTYKVFVFAPDDEQVIKDIIQAASKAGAGVIGNYSQCASITKSKGNWLANENANPSIGKVGEITTIDEVKIEMRCPADKAKEVMVAIASVHPYEEPGTEFIKLEEV